MTGKSGRGKAAKRKTAKRAEPPNGGATRRAGRRSKRWKETVAQRRERAAEIVRRLRVEYPDARCSLDYHNPYQLLVATILSAQCTDERVNQVTPELFARYPTPQELAGARAAELQEIIRSTGFFRNKTSNLLGMANGVVDRHDGRIPATMDELVALPGVGRKTANVVLGNAFGIDEGIVVDTHVRRLSGRLGLSRHTDPVRIEQDLMKLIVRDDWTDLSHLFIHHGRAVCRAPTPRCNACGLVDVCPGADV